MRYLLLILAVTPTLSFATPIEDAVFQHCPELILRDSLHEISTSANETRFEALFALNGHQVPVTITVATDLSVTDSLNLCF